MAEFDEDLEITTCTLDATGTHTVAATQTDIAGNTSTPTTRTFIVKAPTQTNLGLSLQVQAGRLIQLEHPWVLSEAQRDDQTQEGACDGDRGE